MLSAIGRTPEFIDVRAAIRPRIAGRWQGRDRTSHRIPTRLTTASAPDRRFGSAFSVPEREDRVDRHVDGIGWS